MPYNAQFSEAVIKGPSKHQVEMEVGGEATNSKSKPMEPLPMGPPLPHTGKEWRVIFKAERSSRLFPIHFTDKVTEACRGYMMRPSLHADYLLRTLSYIAASISNFISNSLHNFASFLRLFMPQPPPHFKRPLQLLKLYIDLFHKDVLST